MQLKMDTWRSDVFFFVGEVTTSKWTHGEVAVFGSTVYKIFALKCQKFNISIEGLLSNNKRSDGIVRKDKNNRAIPC